MRFSLVDRITSLKEGKEITAVKNLSLAEEYLADHFPGFPVMPGVLMLETLVQAGAWLLRQSDDFRYSTILLKEARALKFNSFVTPGRTLTVQVVLQKEEGSLCILKGAGNVDGESTVSARLTLERFNLADRNPDLADSDRLQIKKLREQFAEIYKPIESSPAA